jgi:hypothetical protein
MPAHLVNSRVVASVERYNDETLLGSPKTRRREDRRMKNRLVGAVIAATAFVVGCNTSRMPDPEDKVFIDLTEKISWKAGSKGELWVALYASGPKGRRMLDFAASQGKNPVAQIQFYDSEGKPISSPTTIGINTRC